MSYILVTRPAASGLALCDFLKKNDLNALHLPTITFESLTETAAFHAALATLSAQDGIIFTSPQAATVAAPLIKKHLASHLPIIAAIGAGTQQALEVEGFTHIFCPENWNSEGLLALPAFQSLAGKQIGIVKGEGGRELLEKVLIARGAQVTLMIAYRRILPTIVMQPYIDLLNAQAISAIVCTSYTGVENLKTLFTDEHWQALQKVPLVVVSPRIKMLAQDLGFQTIWVANNPKHESILASLVERG